MATTHESRITPLGAARTVTGSKYLIEHHSVRVLVDCGLFQGGRSLRERNWEPFIVDPGSIDAVVITHAHLDHCGYLPRLVKDGFKGPVYATADTAKLMGVVLPDSGRLQQEEAEHANRHGYSRHDPALALYNEDDAWHALDSIVSVPFGREFHPATGLTALYSPAGHILGSSIVRVDLEGTARVTFSGDLGRASHPLLRPPAPAGVCDYLFVESTYGDREHVEGDNADRFADLVRRTVERGGTVVVPSFAVDRTEVVLFHMRRLMESGSMPIVPVYVDSPMALAALGIYRDAFADSAEDLRPDLRGDGGIFDLPQLTEVFDVEGSKALAGLDEPAIIIAGAGMATGGRVVHHLARLLPDEKNSVALVGFQVAGSRGRQLVDGATSLKIHGQYVRVRAEVCDLSAFSAHADASELVEWISTAVGDPTVFVVHGEEQAALTLSSRIERELGLLSAVPEHRERLLVR